MMFNSPPGTSDAMDLAKMLTCLTSSSPSPGPASPYRQVRTGLLSYPTDLAEARGQLARLSICRWPCAHVVHVVGFSEADHEATAADVVEGCKIARRAIRNALDGQPDPAHDPPRAGPPRALVAETGMLLEAIRRLAGPEVADPWADTPTLARAVSSGLLDAPQLKGSRIARGAVSTRIVDGACVAVDPATARPLSESERIERL